MNEARQEWVPRAAAPRLRAFVEGYIGYRVSGFPAGYHRGLPSRHMTFIISIDHSIDVVAQTNPKQMPQRYGCVVSGLQATAALIAHNGYQEGVAIELSPLGSRMLFGVPAAELWDLSLELSEVVGSAGRELWERIQVATGWEERFALCDEVLTRLAADRLVLPELDHSWRALVASGGRMTVGELTARTGYSRQHLARRFRSEFGLTPKLAARVIRFERAQQRLRAARSSEALAEIAAACGYFDQAHLNRDFAELAGCTPTELLRDEVPFFQDDGELEGSELLHA